MHLPLRPIFRQSHPNFITVRTAYASKIWAQLTKNLLAKSSTKRFREYILRTSLPGAHSLNVTCNVLQQISFSQGKRRRNY